MIASGSAGQLSANNRIVLIRPSERHELPALGLVAALLMIYPLLGAPTGFGATLVVAVLVGWRVGPWWRGQGAPSPAMAAAE